MPGSIALAEKLVKEKGYFMPMQFENPANPEIHELTTGQEIVNAFAGDLPDAFVAGVGTGGTLTGIGRALKKGRRRQGLRPGTGGIPAFEGRQEGPA